jgi:hypothetical protein
MMKSFALMDAEEEINEIEDKIADLERIGTIIWSVVGTGAAFCSAQYACCLLPAAVVNCATGTCISPHPAGKLCWTIDACVSGVLLTALKFLQNKVKELKEQKAELNQQIGSSGDVSVSENKIESIGTAIGAVVAFAVCAWGIKHGWYKGSSTAVGGGGGTGGIDAVPAFEPGTDIVIDGGLFIA